MSTKRRPLPSDAGDRLTSALGPLDGGRIPGGCDACAAYQTAEPVTAGVWKITVFHDDWCPVLAAKRQR